MKDKTSLFSLYYFSWKQGQNCSGEMSFFQGKQEVVITILVIMGIILKARNYYHVKTFSL